MNNRLKEIVAAGRGVPLPSPKLAREKLSDAIERIAEQGGFLTNEDYNGPAETTLLEESQRVDRELHKGMKLAVAKASGPQNELTRAIFGDKPAKLYMDVSN